MGIMDGMRDWMLGWLLPGIVEDYEWRSRLEAYERYRNYYDGTQKRQIKSNPDQADDNLVENYTGLIVERSISMMLGGEVLGGTLQFELPTDATQDYIDEILEANSENIFLHDAAQNGSIYGTGYIKIIQDGTESKQAENKMVPRLIVLDPRWMKIITPPEDIGKVTGYEMRYNVTDDRGERIARKETTTVFGYDDDGRVLSWVVANFQSTQQTGGRWEPIGTPQIWEYEFPPIIHWKNLPKANSVYGSSELEDCIELQDRINFVSGNISKIIRYHSHPKTWGRGTGMGKKTSWGADEMIMVQGQDAVLQNLEMQSDLSSSRAFRNDLKQALFDISRTVDVDSMKDKVGQLTNFGLRVLYADMLAKVGTKRDLFGDAMLELVHRLLVLGGMPAQPGQLNWPDPLPKSGAEQNEEDGFDLDRGLVSKETISTRRGNDWEQEQERLANEQVAGSSVGAEILKAFQGGRA